MDWSRDTDRSGNRGRGGRGKSVEGSDRVGACFVCGKILCGKILFRGLKHHVKHCSYHKARSKEVIYRPKLTLKVLQTSIVKI